MTKTKALKALYKKLAGVSTKEYTDSKIIQEITKVVEGGGGSSLPEVTAADNGKVLGVVDGAWAKADASGSSLIVTVSTEGQEEEGETYYDLDTPFEDIMTAIEAGQNVILKHEEDTGATFKYTAYARFSGTSDNNGTVWLRFASDYDFEATAGESAEITIYKKIFEVYPDDTCSVYKVAITGEIV